MYNYSLPISKTKTNAGIILQAASLGMIDPYHFIILHTFIAQTRDSRKFLIQSKKFILEKTGLAHTTFNVKWDYLVEKGIIIILKTDSKNPILDGHMKKWYNTKKKFITSYHCSIKTLEEEIGLLEDVFSL